MTKPPNRPRHTAFRTSRDLLGGFVQALSDPGVRVLMGLTTTAVLLAAIVYSRLEGWSLVDSFYFSAVTIATVGYGDLAPKTVGGKIFTVGYLVVGIGLFVALASSVAGHLIHRTRIDLGLDPPDPPGRAVRTGAEKDDAADDGPR